ncbi:DM13 domain-containing protein [Bacteroidia bacterium]|jgi:hypothetical protein|nr:DM13 domain-containing protein [Bacteroidia bacterium]
MKIFKLKTVALLGLIVFASACVKQETPKVANERFEPTESDSMTLSGTFQSSPRHDACGTVEVFSTADGQVVSFLNFNGENGPNLRVYASTSLSDNAFVELGELIAVEGDFSYTTSASTDFTTYKNIIIWCADFDVLFGSAELQ